ncbi:hypothetical protein [Paenibacillus sp. NEAU-GSW1]|uniref:hypothetical protein n=1 Tax=Paenibacillus sp. NEAU-GSW1 TaxID=2682486 RepID=UPI0012E142C9|nr:hypothetical protein [Paenibacillus sp. NEAU-GSW1]MUT67777.1 hypothetical protein [Paenibacillus sp. NEAU-GSW1]
MSSAILFDFADASSAAIACDTLQELGYEPMMHEANRVHIHVEGADLTSALEIAQAHGGRLVEQAAIGSEAVTDTAYSLNAITIPAHVVNEDWNAADEEAEGLRNWNDDNHEDFEPDDGSYDHFIV